MIPRCLFLFVGLILLVSQTHAGVGGGSPAGAVPIEVPEIQYAVIDLGKINDVMPDDKEVDLITLGMDGRLAFSWWDGSNYMVAKWKDGQFTDGSPKSMATKIQYLDPISTDTYGSSVAITGPSSDLLSANGDVLRYSPVVEDPNNLNILEDPYYNSDATALWPYGETDAKDLWWGETGTDGWASQLFLENGNVVGLAGNGYIGIGVLSANTQQVNYIYEEDPQLGKFWGTDDKIGVSPQGDLALNYYEYDTATYYILESAKVLLIDSQGNKTEVRNVSGPTAAQIGKTTVINHNLEFILQDSDLGKFVYYKGAASQGKLETLFPWQFWDTLVRYGSAPKMISLTNSGKLLLNLENRENKGTMEKPKYEWVPRTFIADTIPPALYKKDLKVAKFPEGWNIPFDQFPARCQILENNLIATTVIQTKKQNADGTWTDIPQNDQKKRPGLLIPVELVDTKDGVVDTPGTAVDVKNRDVFIEPRKDINDKNPKSIAWIEPHGSETVTDGPDMPQLTLLLPGTEQMGVKLKWKLEVKYKRPNNRTLPEDTVLIQSGSNDYTPEIFGGTLKIFENPAWTAAVGQLSDPVQPGHGFFGGDATLTWQLVNSDGSPLLDEQKILFRIAGKNPDNTKARDYLEVNASDLWFAYAICKHETSDLRYGGSFYNQFVGNPNGKNLIYSGYRRNFPLAYGEPIWNWDYKDSKPGGFGLFQITGWQGNGNGNIPRDVIWNWQRNMVEGANEIRRDKVPAATSYFKAVKSKYGSGIATPPTVATGKPHNPTLTAWEVSVIVRYNGVGKTDLHPELAPWLGKYTQDPWTYSGGSWHGPKANSQNYLNKVMPEIE